MAIHQRFYTALALHDLVRQFIRIFLSIKSKPAPIHSFLINLPQNINNRVHDDKIYRFVNSVVVVVFFLWCFDRHSHFVCVHSMFTV